jgi:hypothetical protein
MQSGWLQLEHKNENLQLNIITEGIVAGDSAPRIELRILYDDRSQHAVLPCQQSSCELPNWILFACQWRCRGVVGDIAWSASRSRELPRDITHKKKEQCTMKTIMSRTSSTFCTSSACAQLVYCGEIEYILLTKKKS